MILAHETLSLYDKMLFEKAIVQAPFQKANPMTDEACFLYILEGENKTYSALEHTHIKVGESVLMKCGNFMSTLLPDKNAGTYEAIAIHFYPEILKKAYGNTLPSFLKRHTIKHSPSLVKLEAITLIQKYIESILFYFKNPSLVNEDLLLLKLKEIILLLLQTDNCDKIKEVFANLFTEQIFDFKEIIEAHLFSPISVSILAELTNNSLSSFKRKFNKIYNDSPNNYIKNRRLQKASNLLVVTELSISHIAYDCGFNDIAHFSKSFKQKFSVSPSHFRLNQKHKTLSQS